MDKIKVVRQREITDEYRKTRMLLVLDENDIKNTTFKYLIQAAGEKNMPVIFGMPENQYQKGLRGWAKIKILASLIPTLEAVMPLPAEEITAEKFRSWGKVCQPENKKKEAIIEETREVSDVVMMDKTRGLLVQSNCWYIPAGSLIVRNGKVLCSAVSTSFDPDNFQDIPLRPDELELSPGERMNFGETMHSEQLAVARAAKDGIKLEGATIYVSKFPCLPCAMSIIGAGIKTVVFEEDSYGLADGHILKENGVRLLRVKRN